MTKIISSKPWTIEPKVKPSTAPKRKTVSTTKKTTTVAAASHPENTREVTESKKTLQPEDITVTSVGKMENRPKEMKWPFGGGGVMWVEVEGEEEQMKGSAVMEEEEVIPPHTVFEEIFDFEK